MEIYSLQKLLEMGRDKGFVQERLLQEGRMPSDVYDTNFRDRLLILNFPRSKPAVGMIRTYELPNEKVAENGVFVFSEKRFEELIKSNTPLKDTLNHDEKKIDEFFGVYEKCVEHLTRVAIDYMRCLVPYRWC